jgi:hypothetical protein
MLTVHKFPFEVAERIAFEMPRGAEIIHVAMQGQAPCIWAIVDPAAPKELRRFRVLGTGHPIESPPFDVYHHVASFQAPPFVWHLFSEPKRGA